MNDYTIAQICNLHDAGEQESDIASTLGIPADDVSHAIEHQQHRIEFEATYCPEDDKLRITSDGRFDDETKTKIKSAGYRWAGKQECWFAVWGVHRENVALDLAGYIGDEDYGPQERAADRAERFSGYRDKRRAEASGHADTYESGPSAFGGQNAKRVERMAKRHERIRGRALTQWDKAEYWQTRTTGVIGNALYKSSASVRRGRILKIESDIRRCESSYTPAKSATVMQADDPRNWADDDGTTRKRTWLANGSRGGSWATDEQMEANRKYYARFLNHLRLRVAYENQMIGEDGGKVTDNEIVPGGWIKVPRRGHIHGVMVDGMAQVQSVKKSPKTKLVTSLTILGTDPYGFSRDKDQIRERRVNVQRLGEDDYRPPTEKELEAFNAGVKERKEDKKKEKAGKPKKPGLINPTLEDALKLQDIWNQEAIEQKKRRDEANGYETDTDVTAEILQLTQSQYSANSKGNYAACNTRSINQEGVYIKTRYGYALDGQIVTCKVRRTGSQNCFYKADRVIVITDKPQKSLPWDRMAEIKAEQEAKKVEEVTA